MTNAKENLFWSLQTFGWIAYCVVKTLNAYAHGKDPSYFQTAIFVAMAGFIISTALRYIFRSLKQHNIAPIPLLMIVLVIVTLAAGLFSVIEVWTFSKTYEFTWTPKGWEFISNILFDAFVLATWTALYYVINFYILLQEQREKYLQASFQAQQAQLKMLRYQLNPHFLFNTLNAISTLVLEKETKMANTMLSRLSAFLRFSLTNETALKTTLKEEVHALKLYLDIETVRFEDRLELTFDIPQEAEKAMVPSLLLQPLVENAIKYAIAPAENGGTIRLKAAVGQKTLILLLEDSGPGLQKSPSDPSSHGVGIQNTKERLQQLYPGQHHITFADMPTGGLQVRIEIPYE